MEWVPIGYEGEATLSFHSGENACVSHMLCFCPKNWHDRSKWVAIREVSDKIGYLNSLGTK